MKLRYTDRARDDVELAFAWYERQRRGLGFEFLDCVEIAIKVALNKWFLVISTAGRNLAVMESPRIFDHKDFSLRSK